MKVSNILSQSGRLVRASFLDRRPALAYVGGWLGKKNLGDEALLHGMGILFQQYQLFPFDGGRASTLATRLLPNLQGGILGGGTLIASDRQYLSLAERYLQKGNSLVLFGTGVEDVEFWQNGTTTEDWKEVLQQALFVGVRGPVSAKRLMESGCKRVEVVGDPVLAFASDAVSCIHQPRTLGLNIGTSDGNVWGSEDKIATEFTRLATLARQAGWTVRWFVVWPKDLAMTKIVARDSDTENEINCIYESHQEFMNEAVKLTAFVGMKLHATVLSTCALTPSIMVEYRSKCLDYMLSIDQGQRVVRSDQFCGSAVWEQVVQWEKSRSGESEELRDAMRPMRKRQREWAHEVESRFK